MKFKIGDIVCSSLSSPQEIVDIRVGTAADFENKICNFTGEMCYVLKYLSGAQNTVIYACKSVDSNYHIKGSDYYNIYLEIWIKLFGDIF